MLHGHNFQINNFLLGLHNKLSFSFFLFWFVFHTYSIDIVFFLLLVPMPYRITKNRWPNIVMDPGIGETVPFQLQNFRNWKSHMLAREKFFARLS